MNRVLAPLQSCADLYAVKKRLQQICERFGTVARLDVVAADQAGQRRALCFLRMASALEEHNVMAALGIGRFGGDLVVLVELKDPVGNPELDWTATPYPGASAEPQALPHR